MIVFNKATTFGILFLFISLLFGCSEGEIDATPKEMTPTSIATLETSGSPDDAGTEEEPEVKSLRIGVNRESVSLSSAMNSLVNENFMGLLWSGLLGRDNTGKLYPQMAQIIPSYENEGISADGKTYTFLLRPNLEWTDGSSLTAEDCFNVIMETILSEEQKLPPYVTDLASKIDLDSSRPIDARSFVIKLHEAVPEFMTLWSLHHTYPTEAYVEEGTVAVRGNGPYKLLEWTDDAVIFERDKDWPDYAGNIASHDIERIEFVAIDDFHAAFADLVAGDLDVLPVSGLQLNATALPQYVNHSWNSGTNMHAIFINSSAEILSDKSARTSLAMNIAREELLSQLHSTNIGLQLKPSLSWIPPSVWGTSEGKFLELSGTSLLAADSWFIAGGADGSTIELLYSEEDPVQVALAPLLEIHWETTLPVDVVLRSERTEEYYADMVAGAYEIALGQWSQEYLDPYLWLELFGSTSAANVFRFSDDKFDALLAAAVDARSQIERDKNILSANERLAEEVAVIPLFVDSQSILLRSEHAALGESLLKDWEWKSFALDD